MQLESWPADLAMAIGKLITLDWCNIWNANLVTGFGAFANTGWAGGSVLGISLWCASCTEIQTFFCHIPIHENIHKIASLCLKKHMTEYSIDALLNYGIQERCILLWEVSTIVPRLLKHKIKKSYYINNDVSLPSICFVSLLYVCLSVCFST